MRKVNQIARKSTPPQCFEVALALFTYVTHNTILNKSSEHVVASPNFAKFLFGGVNQDHASQKRPETALANQTATVLRGYNTLMPHEFRIHALLVKHRGNCDTTFLEAVWWYSRILNIKTFLGLYDAPMDLGYSSSSGASTSVQPLPTHRVNDKTKPD